MSHCWRNWCLQLTEEHENEEKALWWVVPARGPRNLMYGIVKGDQAKVCHLWLFSNRSTAPRLSERVGGRFFPLEGGCTGQPLRPLPRLGSWVSHMGPAPQSGLAHSLPPLRSHSAGNTVCFLTGPRTVTASAESLRQGLWASPMLIKMCGLWEHTLPPHRTHQLLSVCKQNHEVHRLDEFLILCSSESKIPLIILVMISYDDNSI